MITGIDIPTGVPLLYEFTDDMKPIVQENHAEHLSGRSVVMVKKRAENNCVCLTNSRISHLKTSYLMDNATLQKKIEEVKNQTKAKK